MRNRFILLLIFSAQLFACGQSKRVIVSAADSLKIMNYDQQSGYYQARNPDSAVFFAELGLKLARKLKFLHGEAIMLSRYGHINEQYGNLSLAQKYEDEALAVFKQVNDKAASAQTTGALGLLEGKLGNTGKGVSMLQTALKSDRQRGDTAAIIREYTRLGELEEIGGDTQAAIAYYSKAETLNHGRPLNEEYYALITSLAKLHSKTGNHQKALEIYQQGISKSRVAGHGKQEVTFLRHAANATDSLGDKPQALALHRQSLQRSRELGLADEEARSLMGIAFAVQEQDAEQSITHLKNALTIAHTIKNKQLASEIYIGLSRIYRQQSRYNEALAALEAHQKLVDSLLTRNTGHRIAALQSSYALAESKLKVESLELINDKHTAERNLFLFTAITISLLLLFIAFYLNRTRKLNKKLAYSNEVKDKLFSIIGHDLRNPIGGITQLLAMMEGGHLTPEEHDEMISEMRKQGDITLEILNALLNWGEAQLKGVHVKNTEFYPQELIGKNIGVLAKQAADKSLVITQQVETGLKLYGDSNHFDFVIRNLLSNAIKFSYPGGTIEISALPADRGMVRFSVRDHGKGIRSDQLARFSNTNMEISFGTSGEKGTGIGLMLSREFIAANHGALWAESEEGKGAEFNFTFRANSESDS